MGNDIKGFRVDLYKHNGKDYSGHGTSSRTDSVLVVDVVTRLDRGAITYTRNGLPKDMRVFSIRPGDALMVLLHRPGQNRPVLYDAQITDDGRLLVADWGMYSGVLADSTDSRWSDLVGGPVSVHDRHEWSVHWMPVGDR